MFGSLNVLSKKRGIKTIAKLVALSFGVLLNSCQTNNDKRAIDLEIDGAHQFQKIDGFGVNINTAWWYDGEYQNSDVVKPAIDMLVDSLGATIFRAVIEEMDWELVNDDTDPNNFNWNYYNKIFSSTRFEGVWNTLRYLNQKGITDGLIISLMGGPPSADPLAAPNAKKSWMGDTDYSIRPAMEDEFVETIAALLYYARHTANVQFSLVSPMNETDIISTTKNAEHPDGIVEGPNIPNAVQFARIVKKLAEKLDTIGMGDLRFIVPDAGGDQLFVECLDALIKDPYTMNKIAYWGVHDYNRNATNYKKIVGNATTVNKSFWVTEMAGIGNLFGQLSDDAKAYIFWDGFDCVYQHSRRNNNGSTPPNDWVFWIGEEGKPLIEYIASTKSWTPRKQFFEFAQIFKFVKPGATRIATITKNDSLLFSAFRNPNAQLVIVGRNDSKERLTIVGKLENLKSINSLKMFYTTPDEDLRTTKEIILGDDARFQVVLPAKSTFTFTSKKEN